MDTNQPQLNMNSNQNFNPNNSANNQNTYVPDDLIVTAGVGGVAVVITDNGGGAINESGSYDSLSFNTTQINNRYKCPFCSHTYKSATAKPFYLKKKHSSIEKKSQTQFQSTYLNDFNNLLNNDFSVLHLNIRSLPKNIAELDTIVRTNLFDIISLNETKLDNSFPAFILLECEIQYNKT